MSFNGFAGNPQHNLYLDRDCPDKLDAIESLRPQEFVGERVAFIHEWNGEVCLYTGSAVQVYKPDLSASKLIGALPPGDAVLFQDKQAWASHEGPIRKYDAGLKPTLEEYVVPHGGPWSTGLGIYKSGDRLALAYAFCGGPREWAPELQMNFAKEDQTPAGTRLLIPKKITQPGDVESIVQLGDRLYCAGERGLSIFTFDGTLRKDIPIKGGILHLAASEKLQRVGGFYRSDDRWMYREFDSEGLETFSFPLSGAAQSGFVVFDADGARYLMSEKKIIKLGADGQRQWSHSLLGTHAEAPRFLVYKNGRCAYVDDNALVRLDAAGVESHRIPLPAKKISSPPYLDANGTFWLGLAKQSEKVLKVRFK